MAEDNNNRNSRTRDSAGKLIFENPVLCAQFLRGYLDIPLLKEVQPEDIEDVSERYVHMFTEERNSDVVKKVHIKNDGTPFFFISLIEHKAKVDYNVVMQVFRYMAFIWED
ncbi:MAG: Rpn family recombination-promoting nuclease/putative transposase, partial [Lachnospiraceae bacterium]|nr:Rpn family recombination-promoting nuclease/putative transposase [Lachnospiraceae bacterium]